MADDRQTKLDQTMGSVSPERLEQTRQEVEEARQKLSSPKPPAPAAAPVEGAEGEPTESEGAHRMRKLDLIQDVQLILVDKYQKGTKLMMGAVVLMVLSLLGLVGLFFKNSELHTRLEALQSEQQKLIESQGHIERKAEETKEVIDETKKTVDETQKKVDEAVEAAPKIEIDESGKAKVVLPVKQADDKPRKKPKPAPSGSSAPDASLPDAPPPPTASAPLPNQLPVETKKF